MAPQFWEYNGNAPHQRQHYSVPTKQRKALLTLATPGGYGYGTKRYKGGDDRRGCWRNGGLYHCRDERHCAGYAVVLHRGEDIADQADCVTWDAGRGGRGDASLRGALSPDR